MTSRTIAQSLDWATQVLQGGDSPKTDAKVLLAHVIDKTSTYLFTWPESIVSSDDFARFETLVRRRSLGEPVAYIIGYRDFWTLRLEVSTATLIPRPETELLVELAIDKISDGDQVCDLGTGTGAIALAIAAECKSSHVLGIDRIPEAVALATRNAKVNAITNAEFIQSNWFDAVGAQTFNVIVSNPPYVEPDSPYLTQGDVRFEPLSALTAEKAGLADIEFISQRASVHLKVGGWLLFEHGFEQGEAVARILLNNGYECIETFKDLNGLDRITVGKRKACE